MFGALAAVAPLATACFPNPDDLRRGSRQGGGDGSGGQVGSGSGGLVGTGSGGAAPASGGRSGSGGAAVSTGGFTGDGTALRPTGTGWISGDSNAFGIQGSWYAYADGQGPGGQGPGACQTGAYPTSACSVLTAPPPGNAFPPSAGEAMCVAGSVGRVVNNAMGQPDYDHIWGAGIGFDFADTGTPPEVIGPYNAPAKGVAGIAFDLDMVPGTGIRVDFLTPATENNPASWGGLTLALSPVKVGRNEIRWADVGGPNYIAPPPPFDPTRILSVHFHVPADTRAAATFRFCISNVAVLTR
jgi:hypothetical protein